MFFYIDSTKARSTKTVTVEQEQGSTQQRTKQSKDKKEMYIHHILIDINVNFTGVSNPRLLLFHVDVLTLTDS